MKRDWLVYLVIFSLALNLGTIGTFVYLRYQDNREKVAVPTAPPAAAPMPLRSFWRHLNLDEAQRRDLKRLFPEHRRRVWQIRRQLADKRQELFDLIQVQSPSWPAIQAKIKEISTLQGSLEEEMTRFMLTLKQNLTPAQQAAFLDTLKVRLCGRGACGRMMGPGFRGRGGPGRGPGPGGGPPPGSPVR